MMKQITLAAAICALAGCAVPMQTVDASRAACASYGFQPGSDAFAECVQHEQDVEGFLKENTNRWLLQMVLLEAELYGAKKE
jgi:hypothetical protein